MTKVDIIYTRYSTDMQKEESCEDQEREILAGLAKLGVVYSNPMILKDQAESGTKSDRDAFRKLMDLVREGHVGLLAVDDQSRFSRADNAYLLINDIVFHGGRFISTGEGIDTNQEGWQLRVKVMELHHSTASRETGRRVRRGQKGRILDGNGAAGDHGFGYRTEFVDPNAAATRSGRGPKPKKVVVIYEPEADVIRWIFSKFNSGRSISEIVRELNKRKTPKGQRSTSDLWHHQHVRRILGNTKYIGMWCWGQTETVRDSNGRKRQVPAKPNQIVTTYRPDLRIINDSTWRKAQNRLQEILDTYGTKLGQKARGPQSNYTQLYPPGLLNGLIYCGLCGAQMTVKSSPKTKYLGCANHRRGACDMVARVRTDLTEKGIVYLIGDVLRSSPPWMAAAIDATRAQIDKAANTAPAALVVDKERLAETSKRIAKLVSAVEDGLSDSSAVRSRLKELERERGDLVTRIEEQRSLLDKPVVMPDDAWIHQQLSDLTPLLKDDTRTAALLLRRLLGKVTAHEVKVPGKKRGFARLRFRIDAFRALSEAMSDRLDAGLFRGVACVGGAAGSLTSPEFTLDLGSPSRMDQWAPKIAEMREQGVTWNKIGQFTGLGSGNAWTAWKRWTEQSDDAAAA